MIFCIIKYDRLPTTTVPPSAGFPTVSKTINIVQINSVANEDLFQFLKNCTLYIKSILV